MPLQVGNKEKSEICLYECPNHVSDWLQLVTKEGSLNVKCIRLDNSGENILSIKWFQNQTTKSIFLPLLVTN
jgi:hypothetical protein